MFLNLKCQLPPAAAACLGEGRQTRRARVPRGTAYLPGGRPYQCRQGGKEKRKGKKKEKNDASRFVPSPAPLLRLAPPGPPLLPLGSYGVSRTVFQASTAGSKGGDGRSRSARDPLPPSPSLSLAHLPSLSFAHLPQPSHLPLSPSFSLSLGLVLHPANFKNTSLCRAEPCVYLAVG